MTDRDYSAENDAIRAAFEELNFTPLQIEAGTRILVQADGGGLVEIEYLEEGKS